MKASGLPGKKHRDAKCAKDLSYITLFWSVGLIYGRAVLVDELRAAIGADGGENCEDDESDEEDAARANSEFCAHGETKQAEAGGKAGGDDHERFVNCENGLDGAGGKNGGLGEPSGECGETSGESTEI